MLIQFKDIKRFIKTPITGIVHVGAGKLEEIPTYAEMGVEDVIWIEGDKAIADHQQFNLTGKHILINSVISDKNSYCYFYEMNNTDFSYILKPKTLFHKNQSLSLRQKHRVPTVKLDSYRNKYIFPYHNLLVINTNGSEHKVLMGANEILKKVDYIYTKFYIEELYEGAQKLPSFDKLLTIRGFRKMFVSIKPDATAHIFYVRMITPKSHNKKPLIT